MRVTNQQSNPRAIVTAMLELMTVRQAALIARSVSLTQHSRDGERRPECQKQ